MSGYRTISLTLSLGLVLAAASAGADSSQDCEGLFPDLTGCKRPARYEGFSVPTSMPYYFEEPFINTGASAWAIWHEFPGSSVFDGGDARVLALQLRVAVTDRLALIATKDGYIQMRPDQDLLDDESGWGDLGFGFKYALIDDPDRRFILTPSLRYEMTQGSSDIYQGNGEGMWIPAVSTGFGMGTGHVLADVGATFPVDGDAESSVLFYNVQYGFPVTKRFTPFVAVNGLHYLDGGDGSTLIDTSLGKLPIDVVQAALGTGPFEGYDVANLGSRDVEGHDVISGTVGFRFKLAERIDLGLAYEWPLKSRKDILKQRATLNLLFEL